ncbi:MAG: ROK family transcriptional regulator [Fibrobacteres bacterium]|nr:ROK family transcriptional regulator [Fibrobacterota bacterium]
MDTSSLTSPAVFNKRNIVRLIRMIPGISRADIVKRLGLSTSLVNLYTRELIEDGWIHSTGKFGDKAGRKTNTLEIKSEIATFLCVHADVSGFVFRHVDFSGKTIGGHEVKTASPLNTQGEFLNDLLNSVKGAVEKYQSLKKLDGLVISADGQIELSHGIAFKINGIKDWDTISIKNIVSSDMDTDAYVISSVSSVLYQLMNDDENENFIMMKIAGDLAFGYVEDNIMVKGGIGTAGELSHLRLDKDGAICKCGGKGCLESIEDEALRWKALKKLLPRLVDKYKVRTVFLWNSNNSINELDPGIKVFQPDIGSVLTGNGHAAAIKYIYDHIV